MGPSKGAQKSQKQSNASKRPKTKSTQQSVVRETDQTCTLGTDALPTDFQQLLLDIFRNSFQERLNSDFGPLLQEVKQHLYNRDFAQAFGRQDYLEAYAARWSPSRALGYAQVLYNLRKHLNPPSIGTWNVTCFGGGAGAEVVAFAGMHGILCETAEYGEHAAELSLQAVDIADWSNALETLKRSLVTKPPPSLYTRSNQSDNPLIAPSLLDLKFHKLDLLQTHPALLDPLVPQAGLLTVFFTLNELYSTSMVRTQTLILSITELAVTGTLLLVIDSPGSYSTVRIGKHGQEKQYPMLWMLEHMLFGGSDDDEDGKNKTRKENWERVLSEESVWFRLHKELRYPIELENMRFQVHLYRRV